MSIFNSNASEKLIEIDNYHVPLAESKYCSGWYRAPPAFGDAYLVLPTGLSWGNSSDPYCLEKQIGIIIKSAEKDSHQKYVC